MKEAVHVVNNQLVGVYTESDLSTSAQRPTILFLNSGLLPHVGPYRLYVKLARKFAQLGFNCFRFDLSGIGDSEKHRDSRTYQQQHKADIQNTIDFLQRERNDQRFITFGICTGADNAHRAMVNDDRVVGAVSIDGYSFPTFQYYLNHYLPKLFSVKSWITMIRLALSKRQHDDNAERKAFIDDIDVSNARPSKESVARDYRDLIAKDKKLLAVFTASWPYNYKEQLSDAFKDIQFGEHIQTVYLENAEHIFPLAEDRANLTTAVSQWLEQRFA